MSLIVNLFGGPGCGKSTTAAGLFHELKSHGVNAELSTEFAKDLTWEKRFGALAVQPYVFGKQLMKIERVIGQVDVIITDSPLLLSVIYAGDEWPQSFKQSCMDIFRMYDNLNAVLRRSKPYNPAGRNQTASEAVEVDEKISEFLVDNSVGAVILNTSTAVEELNFLVQEKIFEKREKKT